MDREECLMDPTICLEQQLELAEELVEIIDSDAYSSINGDGLVLLDHLREEKRITDQQHHVLWSIVDKANALAERVVALEEWVQKGGFLPAQWARREP